jgi:hypothetical protein
MSDAHPFRALMHIRSLAAIGFAASVVAASTPAEAQRRVRIVDAIACAQCAIVSQPLATLQSADGAIVMEPLAVRVDSAGRYWLVNQDGLPSIFDARGRFLRHLGRAGAGPGEYLGAVDMMSLSADTIVAFDRVGLRATLLRADLTPIRTVPLPSAFTAGVNTKDGIVVTGVVRTPGVYGKALHRISLGGSQVMLRESFGAHVGPVTDDTPASSFVWWTALDRDGKLWSLDRWHYRLDRWSAGGSSELEAVRESARFPSPKGVLGIGTPTQPPTPQTAGLWVDGESGVMWVAFLVPSTKWRQAWPSMPRGASEMDVRRFQSEFLYTTVVEAIDSAAWRVLARKEFAGRAVGLLPGARLVRYNVDDDGEPTVLIHQLRLQGRGGSGSAK